VRIRSHRRRRHSHATGRALRRPGLSLLDLGPIQEELSQRRKGCKAREGELLAKKIIFSGLASFAAFAKVSWSVTALRKVDYLERSSVRFLRHPKRSMKALNKAAACVCERCRCSAVCASTARAWASPPSGSSSCCRYELRSHR